MEIEHKKIVKAVKGEEVGRKVKERVRKGDFLYKEEAKKVAAGKKKVKPKHKKSAKPVRKAGKVRKASKTRRRKVGR